MIAPAAGPFAVIPALVVLGGHQDRIAAAGTFDVDSPPGGDATVHAAIPITRQHPR